MLGDNLAPFFGAFALTVVAGSTTGKGILDRGTVSGDTMALSDDYVLTAKAAEFGGLKTYDPITVGGVSYLVREVRHIDDGQIVEINLAKA